jgi:hypothetical protein
MGKLVEGRAINDAQHNIIHLHHFIGDTEKCAPKKGAQSCAAQ